jgi:16S rRNA processing protein RimM
MADQGPPDGRGSRSRDSSSRGRASALRRSVPEYLTIARIATPHGIRGELKIRLETDFTERFRQPLTVYIGPQHLRHELQSYRPHKGHGILKLEGLDSRDEAEALRGLEIQVPIAEAMPLAPGQYYEYQLEGLAVSTEEGEDLGVVAEILQTGGNAVLIARGRRGEVLIPALRDVMREVDLEEGRLVVRLPRGLLD